MHDADEMGESFLLSFKEGVRLHEQPEGGAWLQASGARAPLPQLSPGLRAVLRTLSSDGATIEQLVSLAVRYDGGDGLPRSLSFLRRFIQHGMLCHTVTYNGARLATLVPLTSSFREASDEPVTAIRCVMSRFAYLHTVDGQFVLESPLAHAKILLHDRRALALLQSLAKPHNLRELCGEFRDVPSATVALFISLLLQCRMLSCVSDDGQVGEEQTMLAQWDFHDLLFHARSRLGRHENPFGATFRFLNTIDPLPAVKPSRPAERVSLYQPDIDALKDKDVSFTRVLEERRSRRTHGDLPITATQLGEFLYRTARVKFLFRTAQDSYERSNRPYPSGGACYELELYVVVNACTGLPAGLYHYSPQVHQLSKVTGQTPDIEALLERARHAVDQQGRPQILLILAARFQRVTWKYEAMAYALILKHVGVLYQTMYLVAEAMGLAACAVGGGDSDLFAAAAGTDYYTETSVGEFTLGSRAVE